MHNHNSQGPHFEKCGTMRISVTEAINGPRKCQHECKHTHAPEDAGRIEPNDSPRIRTEADDDANDEWAKDEGNA